MSDDSGVDKQGRYYDRRGASKGGPKADSERSTKPGRQDKIFCT